MIDRATHCGIDVREEEDGALGNPILLAKPPAQTSSENLRGTFRIRVSRLERRGRRAIGMTDVIETYDCATGRRCRFRAADLHRHVSVSG
jgi:hypothetical protein